MSEEKRHVLRAWLDRPPPRRVEPLPTEEELRLLPGYSIATALPPAPLRDERDWYEFAEAA